MPAEVLEKPATVEDVAREVSKIRSIVTDAVEVAEDVIEEAQHAVKQRPLQAMGIAFAAGVLAGGFLAWIGFRCR